uniref:Putative secreted protein n=1 Tax=Anopheles triannulatus TaxID=58253 RepID=A0A2M4B780_9DIPT
MPLFVILSTATTITTTSSSTNLHYPPFLCSGCYLFHVYLFSLSNICDTMPIVCCIVDCDYALTTARACCFMILSGLLR